MKKISLLIFTTMVMISVSITGCFDDDEIDIEKKIKTQDYLCVAWKLDNTDAVIIGKEYSLLYDPDEDALSNYWNDETGKPQTTQMR